MLSEIPEIYMQFKQFIKLIKFDQGKIKLRTTTFTTRRWMIHGEKAYKDKLEEEVVDEAHHQHRFQPRNEVSPRPARLLIT